MLTLIGFVVVYSASFVTGLVDFSDPYHFIVRQVAWAAVGAVLLVMMARLDYSWLRPMAVPIMAATIIALLAVLVIGVQGGGARRWIGVGELTIQPAEFAKLAVIIYLAAWLSSKRDDVRSFEHGLLPFVMIIGSVSFLIMLQPNLGSTLIILVITVTMFWVAGASFAQMFALGTSGIVCMVFLATAAGYRMERLTAFFNAESDPYGNGFQTLQSLIAIGNGGIHGLGLGASRAKFFYIPESHTDGVFAIIGEEAGLIATIPIIILYMILMVRGFQIASRARDDFGRLIATGVTTWVTIQALLNIGGITRVVPLAGVPLPFLSYGSNSMVSVLLAMGLLISISRFGNDRGRYLDKHPVDTRRRVVRRKSEE